MIGKCVNQRVSPPLEAEIKYAVERLALRVSQITGHLECKRLSTPTTML